MKISAWTIGLALLVSGPQASAAAPAQWNYDNNVDAIACDDCCEPQCDASYECCEPECACQDDCCEPDCGCEDECCEDPCCGDECECGDECSSACAARDAIGALSIAGLLGIESPLEIGGWTNVAYTSNNIPLSQAYDDLLSFDDVPDHAQLAQQWFYVGKTVDGSNGFDVGGRIDAIYGTDAQKTQAFGNPLAGVRNFGSFDASLDHGEYGWAIPQAYGEVALGDLAVKVGHFFTPIGYEVIPATGNFFHSHSYTMFNSEPFTHTGVLGTYAGMEAVTLYGGWSLGWDTGFDQLNQGNCFLGGFALNVSDDIAFTYLNTYGNFGWRDGGDDNSYEHSCVLSVNLVDNLQYVAQSDLIRTDNPARPDDGFVGSAFDTIGLNNYLFYTVTDMFKLGARYEWWKADGVSFNEVTCGVNISLADNLVVRPEYRYDWAPSENATLTGPINENTAAVDVVLSY